MQECAAGWSKERCCKSRGNCAILPVMVLISDLRNAPDENHFTMSRTGEIGGYIGSDLDVKKEIRVNSVQFAFNF